MARRRRLVAIVVAAVVLLAVLDLTVGSSDMACSQCHVRAVSTPDPAHEEVSCLSCHLDAGLASMPGFAVEKWLNMYPRAAIRAPQGPSRGVTREACAGCHDEPADVTVSRGIRIDHRVCAAGPARCDGCHAAAGHGESARTPGQPVMEECVACHSDRAAPRECDTCHDGKLQTQRLQRGPWRVTHGTEWKSTHGMGHTDACSTCHPQDFCVKCHGVAIPHPATFGRTHGAASQEADASCDTCHERTTFCDRCHGVTMPHGDRYLVTHSGDAESFSDARCLRCHDSGSCTDCHDRHIHPYGPWSFLRPGGDGDE